MSSSDLRGSTATLLELESGNEDEGLVGRRSEEEWWFISRKTDEPIFVEKKMLKKRVRVEIKGIEQHKQS